MRNLHWFRADLRVTDNRALQMLCKKYHINRLYFNKQYEWDEQQRDAETIKILDYNHVVTYAYDDQTIFPSGAIPHVLHDPYQYQNEFKKVNYPAPLVDYKNSRKEVVYAFKKQ